MLQTPDTDLNQHVRRRYGTYETRVLLEKMQTGDPLPKMTPDDCTDLLYDIMNDKQIHSADAKS